jgi:hypothetical protein
VSLVKNSNDKKVVRQFPLGSRFGADSQLHQGRRERGGNKPGEANAPTTAINALASAGNLGAQK